MIVGSLLRTKIVTQQSEIKDKWIIIYNLIVRFPSLNSYFQTRIYTKGN